MKYGDIVAILFVIMALYYVAMIAMDLYKAKLSKESEKEKEKETEIDISDEVEGFKTIHVSREYPNGRLDAETEVEAENEDSQTETEKVDAPDESQDKPVEGSKPKDKVKISESQLRKVNMIKSRAEERMHQHRQEHQPKETPVQEEIENTSSDKKDDSVEHDIPKKDPAARPGYRPPIMLGGMSVEEIVGNARRRSMGDDSAMAGIIHSCEAA